MKVRHFRPAVQGQTRPDGLFLERIPVHEVDPAAPEDMGLPWLDEELGRLQAGLASAHELLIAQKMLPTPVVVDVVTGLHIQLSSACRVLEAHDVDAAVLKTLRPLPLEELLALLDGAYRGAVESGKG